ncbi:cupin domain-containing protein [Planctomycetales bacterium ZRK34]|nr:cupin domain-containing protein [Planctomycetales bacterium ZRK34]
MTQSTPSDQEHPAGRQPAVVRRADWATDENMWLGHVLGENLGTNLTVLFYSTDTVGEGPRWHVHPYDEVFIVRAGRALFTIGDQKIEAGPGDILMGPANIPHKYHSLGPDRLQTTDIHLSDQWIQTDLDDPELTA